MHNRDPRRTTVQGGRTFITPHDVSLPGLDNWLKKFLTLERTDQYITALQQPVDTLEGLCRRKDVLDMFHDATEHNHRAYQTALQSLDRIIDDYYRRFRLYELARETSPDVKMNDFFTNKDNIFEDPDNQSRSEDDSKLDCAPFLDKSDMQTNTFVGSSEKTHNQSVETSSKISSNTSTDSETVEDYMATVDNASDSVANQSEQVILGQINRFSSDLYKDIVINLGANESDSDSSVTSNEI
ncbi:hypothetical protein DASC09_010710 [Saccharomycopsis crataegensis]|uniref:Uncharacterized protein n=1 Tax=Saccharomycopsis crataegensis TaxID=43959 RepID=A0AAV5QGF8_9ASCO|nr:hypothetical protein DASC09_010710 [Saccharomycopsis crataegensis]